MIVNVMLHGRIVGECCAFAILNCDLPLQCPFVRIFSLQLQKMDLRSPT